MSQHNSLLPNITSTSAVAANPFKSPDGLLNFDAVFKLNSRVEAAVKAVSAKTGTAVPVTSYYVIATKAKPVQYSASLAKKDDLKYHTRRATKVAVRKRLAPASLARVKVLLTLVNSKDIPAALLAQVKVAAKAIEAHLTKHVKVKETVAKKKSVIRDDNAASFEVSVNRIKEILFAGGLKETSFVEANGMFGRQVLIKLGPDSVVSLGKADTKRFNAARKAATSISSDELTENVVTSTSAGNREKRS